MTATQHTIVDALISRASAAGLGEAVSWGDVEKSIFELALDPAGPSLLRARLHKLNDKSVAATLEDWLLRAAAGRDAAARDAARPSDKILAPAQGVTLSLAASALLLTLVGTLGLPAAAILGASALFAGGSLSVARWRLSKREDAAKGEAESIRRLASIAAQEKPSLLP